MHYRLTNLYLKLYNLYMVIKYKGRIVDIETTIRPKGALLDTILGGPRTSHLVLKPNSKNEHEDTVQVVSSYGSREITGSGINRDPLCRRNKIRWGLSREALL